MVTHAFNFAGHDAMILQLGRRGCGGTDGISNGAEWH